MGTHHGPEPYGETIVKKISPSGAYVSIVCPSASLRLGRHNSEYSTQQYEINGVSPSSFLWHLVCKTQNHSQLQICCSFLDHRQGHLSTGYHLLTGNQKTSADVRLNRASNQRVLKGTQCFHFQYRPGTPGHIQRCNGIAPQVLHLLSMIGEEARFTNPACPG